MTGNLARKEDAKYASNPFLYTKDNSILNKSISSGTTNINLIGNDDEVKYETNNLKSNKLQSFDNNLPKDNFTNEESDKNEPSIQKQNNDIEDLSMIFQDLFDLSNKKMCALPRF